MLRKAFSPNFALFVRLSTSSWYPLSKELNKPNFSSGEAFLKSRVLSASLRRFFWLFSWFSAIRSPCSSNKLRSFSKSNSFQKLATAETGEAEDEFGFSLSAPP
uniref:Uncharacterized protein n=1 Tax=Opuntia streptacantha TaxID=393608 RepID=A0A7C8ZTY6_OPUST